MAIVAYLACRMSGRSKAVMVKEAKDAIAILSKYGIECISPVLEENIDGKHELLSDISEEKLIIEWKKDKAAIKRSHVLIDLASATSIRSEGATCEYGYARYCLFLPTIRLFPKGLGPSVTRLENALVVQSLDEAGIEIIKRWGTRYQRIMWRIRERIFWKWLRLLRLQFLGFFR